MNSPVRAPSPASRPSRSPCRSSPTCIACCARPRAPTARLAPTALATGIAGIVLKLSSGVPELAAHQAHLAPDTQLGAAVHAMGDGATLFSLYPLAVFCAATAIVAFRTRALPRWLAAGAAVTAAALAVNGAFLGAGSVPALLLFLLWTLVTSVYLLRRTWRKPAPAAPSRPQAAKAVASA